jgi:hypothetical protein
MESRFITVSLGAVVTLFVGLLLTSTVVGTLFGPIAGGIFVSTRSPADRQVVDAFAAGLVGGVGPAAGAQFVLALAKVPPPYVSVPAFLALVGLCGVLSAGTARVRTGRLDTFEHIRR